MADRASETLQPESPLAADWSGSTPATLQGSGLTIRERPNRGKLVLVTDGSDTALRNAVAVLGKPLPDGPDEKTGIDPCCIWRAPGRWLIVHDRGEVLATGLNAAMNQGIGAAIDVSDGWVSISLEGRSVRNLFRRGCDMDLHPRGFAPGRFAETVLAGFEIILHARPEGQDYDLLVERALAVGLWVWLKEQTADFSD
ncbi:MAG: sarcosine oxidase subunit gamma [Alphaproteobacteria bacterium]